MLHNQTAKDSEHQRKYAEAIKQASLGGITQFQSWFNTSESVDQAILNGYWDMTVHILTPKVCEYTQKPGEKIALEIGYGGGRLVNAACNYFKHVIGIDIHDENQMVEVFLNSQRKHNFTLLKTSGRTIEVDTESIDFIYSFIVLQHLPAFNVFENYINEAYRCLKRGGIAQLYFGKYSRLSVKDQLRYFTQGYKEVPDVEVNRTSLVIRVSKVKQLCARTGFKVVDIGTSYKRVPDGYPGVKGGQNYVTVSKE